MLRVFAVVLLAASVPWTPPKAVAEGLLSEADRRIYKDAFRAAARSRWAEAKRLSEKAENKLPGKVIRWTEMTRRGAHVGFADYVRFIRENPHWPGQEILRQRAEEAIRDSTPAEELLRWFSRNVPTTTEGRAALGRALLGSGLDAQARDVLREAWIGGRFNRKSEQTFLSRFGRLLIREDHIERLERLLWKGHRHQATRMLRFAPKDIRALATARIRLRRNRGNVGSALRRVPEELKRHPGLLYERLRWRRSRGRVDDALEILENPPAELVRPDLWWLDREIVIRRVLERGEASRAYELARDHRNGYGAEYAEAEWLAGWIALSFLKQHERALLHFERMYEVASFPISLARGAFWAGRASEQMGNTNVAREWYGKAAEFDLTYYGQLAAARIDARKPPATLPEPDADRTAAFYAHELVRVVMLLDELGEEDRMRPFFERFATVFEQPDMQVLAGRLALAFGRPDLAVRVARKAYRWGDALPVVGYPLIEAPEGWPEQALLLSIARQESNFMIAARSASGARGLMQLMPATARGMARRIGERYSRARLTRDPLYNLKLGRAYLRWLLERYDGSYLLAIAGYNAGPAAVNRWLKVLGDPRTGEVDPIDWVELIQYPETRNYVQRVLEGLHIYRRRLSDTRTAYTLDHGPAR